MVTLKMLLNRVAWDAVLILALLAASYALNWNVPSWIFFTLIFGVLGLQIIHMVRSDQKRADRARQAAFEHRAKNA